MGAHVQLPSKALSGCSVLAQRLSFTYGRCRRWVLLKNGRGTWGFITNWTKMLVLQRYLQVLRPTTWLFPVFPSFQLRCNTDSIRGLIWELAPLAAGSFIFCPPLTRGDAEKPVQNRFSSSSGSSTPASKWASQHLSPLVWLHPSSPPHKASTAGCCKGTKCNGRLLRRERWQCGREAESKQSKTATASQY